MSSECPENPQRVHVSLEGPKHLQRILSVPRKSKVSLEGPSNPGGSHVSPSTPQNHWGHSNVRLHPPLERPAGVGILGRRLGVMRGGRGGFAGLVEGDVGVLLAAATAADAAVTLRVQEGAAVAHGAALELALAQLDGAAAHPQHQPLPVVEEAALPAQRAVDVGEGHPGGDTLLGDTAGPQVTPPRDARQRDAGGGVMLLEGVDAVVAVGGVLARG